MSDLFIQKQHLDLNVPRLIAHPSGYNNRAIYRFVQVNQRDSSALSDSMSQNTC
jgi:hypothetical protein